jgi:hypothetical protein
MSEQALSLPATAAAGVSRRLAAGSLVAFLLLGNAALIVLLWVHGGNLTGKSTATRSRASRASRVC